MVAAAASCRRSVIGGQYLCWYDFWHPVRHAMPLDQSTPVGSGRAAVSRLGVTVSPGAVPAGGTVTLTVRALDARGRAVSYDGPVRLGSTDPQAVLPPDGALVNGVGTFLVVLRSAGVRTIRVEALARASLAAAVPVTVAPGRVAALRLDPAVPLRVG